MQRKILKPERLQMMKEYIDKNDVVPINNLCKKFDISINTVRSDINELVENGTVMKIYGGVRSALQGHFQEFYLRDKADIENKGAIAKIAAEYVEEGDIIFIDTGTTTMNIVDFLNVEKLTVITNNLAVMNKVANLEKYDLICVGEIYQRSNNSFYMEQDKNYAQRYNIQKCFFSTVGISSSGAVTSAIVHEYKNKLRLMKHSPKSFLLMDGSKFGNCALYSYANICDMDIFITNGPVPEELVRLCQNSKTIIRLTHEFDSAPGS